MIKGLWMIKTGPAFGWAFFDPVLSVMGGGKLIGNGDVVCFYEVRWF